MTILLLSIVRRSNHLCHRFKLNVIVRPTPTPHHLKVTTRLTRPRRTPRPKPNRKIQNEFVRFFIATEKLEEWRERLWKQYHKDVYDKNSDGHLCRVPEQGVGGIGGSSIGIVHSTILFRLFDAVILETLLVRDKAFEPQHDNQTQG